MAYLSGVEFSARFQLELSWFLLGVFRNWQLKIEGPSSGTSEIFINFKKLSVNNGRWNNSKIIRHKTAKYSIILKYLNTQTSIKRHIKNECNLFDIWSITYFNFQTETSAKHHQLTSLSNLKSQLNHNKMYNFKKV